MFRACRFTPAMLHTKIMNLVSDIGSEIALAVLVEKKYSGKIESSEIISFISKVRDVLEPVVVKDHLYKETYANEETLSH